MLANIALGVSTVGFALLAYHQFSSLHQQAYGLLLSVIAVAQGAVFLRQTSRRERLASAFPHVALACAAAAVVLIVLAQYRHNTHQDAAGALTLALAFWAVCLLLPSTVALLRASGHAIVVAHPLPLSVRRLALALVGVALLTATFLQAADGGVFTLPLLVSWVSGIVIWWLALREPGQIRFHLALPRFHREYTLVLLLLGLGVLSFFYRLPEAPAGMFGDHAAKLMDVENISNGQYPIYFAGNFGREPIHFYLAYLNTALFGYSFMTLKTVSAAVAVGTLLALYWAGREIDGPLTGLLALALGAACLWLMILARNGFRAGEAALATTLLVGMLWRALHSGRRVHFLLAGVILGVGLYTYTAFRVMPLLVVVGVGLAFLTTPRSGRFGLLANALALVLMAAIIYAPLAGYWRYDPGGYWHRVNHLSNDFSIDRLLFALQRAVGVFNLYTDVVWFNTAPDRPALGPVAGGLLLLSLPLWLWRVALNRRPVELLLPLALLTGILPTALAVGAPIELPNALRSVVGLAPALLLGAAALAFVLRMLARVLKPGRFLAIPCVALLLGLHGALNWDAYFNLYTPRFNRMVARELHVARQIRQFEQFGGSIWDAYVLSDDGFAYIYESTVASELGHPWAWRNYITSVEPGDCANAPVARPLLFILDYQNADFARRLYRWLDFCYPGHQRFRHEYVSGDLLFEVAYVFKQPLPPQTNKTI